MKLTLAAAVAACALLAGGAFSGPANAANFGNGRWCLHAPWSHAHDVNCAYQTLAQCEKYEHPTNGWCTLNKAWTRDRRAEGPRMRPHTNGMR